MTEKLEFKGGINSILLHQDPRVGIKYYLFCMLFKTHFFYGYWLENAVEKCFSSFLSFFLFLFAE